MRYNHNKIYLAFLSFIVPLATLVQAQEVANPAALDKLKTEQVSSAHGNAAGMSLEPSKAYTIVGLSGAYTVGDYHKAMEGKSLRSLSAEAEGAVQLGKYHFWGRFLYDAEHAREVGYNASLTRPYRGMPYFVIDKNLSDWKNQLYLLQFKVGTPVFHELLSFGLDAGYSAEQGAKQRDVRSHNNAMNLYLQPSLLLYFNPETQLSFLLKYDSYKEDSRGRNINVYIDQTYYEMFGLGSATPRIGSGRTTNYLRNSFGGEMQYNIDSNVRAMIYLGANSSVEDAEISFSNPQRTGTIYSNSLYTGLELRTKAAPSMHALSLRYDLDNIKGIQYISQYDNTESFRGFVELYRSIRYLSTHSRLDASYEWSWNENHAYEWLFGLNVGMSNQGESYVMPGSSAKIIGSYAGVTLRKVTVFNADIQPTLDVAFSGSFHKNHKAQLFLDRKFVDPFVAQKLLQHDSNYMGADLWTGDLSITYSQKVKANSNTTLFLKGHCRHINPVNVVLGDRFSVGATVGCLF